MIAKASVSQRLSVEEFRLLYGWAWAAISWKRGHRENARSKCKFAFDRYVHSCFFVSSVVEFYQCSHEQYGTEAQTWLADKTRKRDLIF
jgi:hypothetical protein